MYAREEARIRSALGARVLAVEHVGSTAVPGLPAKDRIDINLHVFGPDCDEYLRHVIFRDWLCTHPEDRGRYAARKFEAAAEHPLSMAHYVAGKGQIVVEILQRAGLR